MSTGSGGPASKNTRRVIVSLMPKGVEHWLKAMATGDVDAVIVSLMPKGVEHLNVRTLSIVYVSDCFVDAERR